MLCAIIGDALGNFSALDAVLGAVEEAGILTILQTGDVAVGPEPDACIRRLREAGARCVQGNTDRILVRFNRKRTSLASRLDEAEYAALADASDRISSVGLEWIAALPKVLRAEVDGIAMLLCHGAPDGGTETLDEGVAAQRLARYREEVLCALVATGGPAAPFHRWVADTLFVHPGPVAVAAGIAQYAVVDTDTQPWSVGSVQVRYA